MFQNPHPLSKNIQKGFKCSSFLRIWRSHKNNFHCCICSDFLDYWEKISDFDLEQFKSIIKQNNGGHLPDGYYYCDHQSQRGGFLETDDYSEAIALLKLRGLIID